MPGVLEGALLHAVLACVEPRVAGRQWHRQRVAQRVGKGHVGLAVGARFVVGDPGHQDRDDVGRAAEADEPPDLVGDVLALPRVGRAEDDQLPGRGQVPLHRLVILRAGQVGFVAKDVEVALRHWEVARGR